MKQAKDDAPSCLVLPLQGLCPPPTDPHLSSILEILLSYDNVSVAAGKTIKLIEKYKIHSCPDYYNYKKTKNFHFRAKEVENNKAYPISKIIKIPTNARGDLADLANHGLTEDEVQRLKSYMNKNPFPENDRFYILEPPINVTNAPGFSGIKTIYF